MPIKTYIEPPYYDDFDEAKNYLRILFRPGHAVQARELTQMQTAIQAQIDRHGRHVFKEGSPVLGGNMSFETTVDFIKVESTFSTTPGVTINTSSYLDELVPGKILTSPTSGLEAIVLDVLGEESASEPITIYVKYLNSGTDNETKIFSYGEVLTSDTDQARTFKIKTAGEYAIGYGSRFSIAEGVFFVNGNFVYSAPGSLIVSRYTSNPSVRVVFTITESVVTPADDETLTDNSTGTPNAAAPGAHRYQIALTLGSQPFSFQERDANDIIQLMVIQNGVIRQQARTEYSALADNLAQRTYEESGNYTVGPFLINIREHYDDGTNNGLYTVPQLQDKYRKANGDIRTQSEAIAYSEDRLAVGLEKSVAYVNGYRIALEDVKYIDLIKARDTGFFNGASVVAPIGNYVYVNVTQSLPDVDNFTTMDLRNSGNTVIGTARARSIEKVTGTLHKLYLFDIKMQGIATFVQVTNVIQLLGALPSFTATVDGTFGSRVYEGNVNSLVFPLPFRTVSALRRSSQEDNDTFYTVKRTFTNLSVSGTDVTVSTTEGTFKNDNLNVDWIGYNQSNGASVTFSAISAPTYNVSNGIASITLTISSGATNGDVISVIGLLEKNLIRKTKTLRSPVEFAKTNCNVTPGGYDSLGFTDVFKLVHVKDLSVSLLGGGYLDITDHYELDNGQRDNFYGVGRIRLKPGFSPPLNSVTGIQIKVQYFSHSTSGDYFSVESYGDIDYDEIPAFQSANGVIELRDALDFRPTKDNGDNNFTGTGSSLVDMLKPNSVIKTDIQYYLNRIDKVYVDKYGNFGILKGISALDPEIPVDPADAMVLYELYIDSYTFGPESVRPKMIDNRRYTMRDIGRLENRIKNLEYYTSLSLLEKETASYQLPADSFRNGFVVDSFYGHNIGNPAHPDYSCSIDRANGILRPQFVEENIRLIFESGASSGYRITGPLITLDYTEVDYIEQPYASYSEFVNPYNVFTWNGDLRLSPSTDNWKDTQNRPNVIINQSGVYDSFKMLADSAGVTGTVWNEWQTNWSGVTASNTATSSSAVTGSTTTGLRTDNWTTTTTTAVTTTVTASAQSREGVRTDVVPDTVRTNLGSRVVEVNIVPFIRSRIVSFKAERLKPNTKLYAFFDGKNITDYTTTTATFFTFNDFENANPQYTSSFTFNNRVAWPTEIAPKTDLVTDASGSITGFFIIPNNNSLRFNVGQRVFRLTDDPNNLRNGTTTFAEVIYEASGLLESKENQILSTTVPRFVRTGLNDNRVVTSTSRSTATSTATRIDNTTWADPPPPPTPPTVVPPPPPPAPPVPVTPAPPVPVTPAFNWWDGGGDGDGWNDPLAQTIMVDEPGGIFATSIDLYFETVDEDIPVTIYLVPTEVGLPTMLEIPFSRVTKVLTTADASADASVSTNFAFEAPVHLQQNVEYAIVIMSMSDKPKVWVSQMGEYDVKDPSYRISKQPYNGVFFKSQNASTWTPEQDKDLKFKLNRANFRTNPATVSFWNVPVQPTDLVVDPIYTTTGSNIVKVYHKNHGLFESSEVDILGVIPTDTSVLNGIPITEINKTHIISRIERDYYYITTTSNATATGRAGGTEVTSTGQVLMDVMQTQIQELAFPMTYIGWNAITTSGKSLAGSEQELVEGAPFPIIPNENMYFNRPQCVPNERNEPTAFGGFQLIGTLSTATSYLSPVIDMDRMSLIAISNLIDNPWGVADVDGTNYVEEYIADDDSNVAKGASGDCKYVTRRIQITGEANNIRVLLSVNRPTGTGIALYYKVQGTEDSDFDNLPWVLQNPDTTIPLDDNPNSYTEIEYSIDSELGGVEFTSMAFKIVLTSQNSSFVPSCRNLRAIAFYS